MPIRVLTAVVVSLACACTVTGSDLFDGADAAPGASDAVAVDSGGADCVNGCDDAAPGTDPAPDAQPPAPATCDSATLCDGFETAAGGLPDPALWSVVTPNCSGDGVVQVDETVAHTGTRSVKVTASGGYCNHVFIGHEAAFGALTGPVYGRFYVRFDDELGDGHVTFMAMADSAEAKDLRMGGQNRILMWNRESDDATLPELSPAGVALSTAPAAGAWTCVEFEVDGAAGTLRTWVDGTEVAGLVVDDTPTPDIDRQWLNAAGWNPVLADFKLGWESYAGQAMTLWFDDVALAAARIPCDGP